ncbi:MAG TPA: T6SS effector BTH_I2691 family protein, partial [Rhizobacter sp.]|nr:T6SS effector BTH_I2691 family protein [Rhizobacter sp.]
LDEPGLTSFRRELETFNAIAFAQADERVPDHVKWFESARLVAAFDIYDPKDANSGYHFAAESAICSIGMSGCKAGEEKIDAWVKAPEVGRSNLYMRGVYFNQQTLIAEASKASADVQAAAANVEAVADINAALMLKLTKNVVSGFKSVDSAFDEWARNQGQVFSKKWVQPSGLGKAMGVQHGFEILFQHKVSDMTRVLFRSGLNGRLDKALTARISGLLYARLGSVAERLAFDELMLKTPPKPTAPEKLADGYKGRSAERNQELADRRVEKKTEQIRTRASQIAGEVDGSLDTLVADARAKAQAKVKVTIEEMQKLGDKGQPTNNYHQARIGVVLGCIEMIALGDKLWKFENNSKGWLEVGGSIMAIFSIVLDTFYAAAKSVREIAPYKSIGAINKGADIVRGGFKLGAGLFSMGAGICSALLDLSKIHTASDKNLKAIYTMRAMTGFIGAGFTMAAAFSYAEPLLLYTAKGYVQHKIRYRILISASGLALRLAARVRLLVWVARFNLAGLALTALEIGYLYFKDDDLQNWCEKCTFRKEKKTKNWLGGETKSEQFEDVHKELEALEKACQAVGMSG